MASLATMPRYLDPRRFAGKPMTLRTMAPGDHAVEIDGETAGRIMRVARSSGRSAWLWSVTGPSMVTITSASSGEVETLAEAKREFRRAFDAWLADALSTGGETIWHG